MAIKTELIGSKRLQRAFEQLTPEATKELKQGIGAALLMVQNDARLSIQKGPKSGRIYRRKGRSHQASAPGQPPATDFGHLVSHINHKQEGLHGTVGVHELQVVKYARRLEFGGRDSRGVYIAPRPFLWPAYNKNRQKITKRLARALPESLRKLFHG